MTFLISRQHQFVKQPPLLSNHIKLEKQLFNKNITHMKNFIYLFLAVCIFAINCHAQTTITVSGKHIIGPCGDTLLLRGVNYAPYNWGHSPDELHISEIAKSKANTIRIVWYANRPSVIAPALYDNITKLDSVLSKSIRAGLIPIIELHDQTCQNSPEALKTLATWFIIPAVKNLIEKYKHSIVINIANEALYVAWTGDAAAASTTFINTYAEIIDNIRTEGIKVPIMIDAPDCGMSIDAIASMGSTLMSHDPESNLIFSTHAYWTAYDGMDSSVIRTKLLNALSKNVPIVIGEIANFQDDPDPCDYALNYEPLLKMCKELNIGWIAWSWDRDRCTARQLTTNGRYENLTAFGKVIFNDVQTGINTAAAAKSRYLTASSCDLSSASIEGWSSSILLYPNPAQHTLHIQGLPTSYNINFTIYDFMGNTLIQSKYQAPILISNLPAGLYLIQLSNEKGEVAYRTFRKL